MKKILTVLLILCTLFACACTPTVQPTASPEGTQGSTETAGTVEPTPAPTMLPTDESLAVSKQIENGFINATNTTPEFHEMTDFNPTGTYAGIKAGWYEGMEKNGKKTKVFAYIGFPKNASADNKVPAIVLVHGGGGHAFLQWVKMWNDRGYAAIAMDNTGYFPTKVNAGSTETNGDWRQGIPKDLKEDGYANAPNNDDLQSSNNKKASNMWMYHAVGQTILASNLLRADERVDPDKVGVTGISWGGLITSITMGYDSRFAFAIPVYCTGYSVLNEWGNMYTRFTRDNGTQELWAPENRYDKVTMPVLWLCWNDDGGLWVKSNSLSYLDGLKNNPQTRLSMKHKMFHSHSSAWSVPENMAFADSIVKGGAKLAQVVDNSQGSNLSFTIDADGAPKVTATLYYLTKAPTTKNFKKYTYEGTFIEEHWNTLKLDVNGNVASGTLPDGVFSYYLEVKTTIGGKECVASSVYTEVK